ncbi:hypothetical protein E2C01_069472 [Portunus trituberculatus]|uniref:Uncharacterized protein n=1 Tax=Portunus trituberculatus TaxID=210409 RepID=A0A5B7I0V4_PORTR|nr:hypothetical protein [Portunus trituberculatus]
MKDILQVFPVENLGIIPLPLGSQDKPRNLSRVPGVEVSLFSPSEQILLKNRKIHKPTTLIFDKETRAKQNKEIAIKEAAMPDVAMQAKQRYEECVLPGAPRPPLDKESFPVAVKTCLE